MSSGASLSRALDETHPDASLGSLGSSFASASSGLSFQSSISSPSIPSSATVATPSPENSFSRLRSARTVSGRNDSDSALHSPVIRHRRGASDEEYGAITPGRSNTPVKRTVLADDTPVADKRVKSTNNMSRTKTGGTLTLREQEKLVEAKDKEIFNLKLQIHFLNEKLSAKVPEEIEVMVKNNIDIKILNQTLSMDVKSWRKAARDLERELKSLQSHSDKISKDLEEQLDDREREVEDLRHKLELERASLADDRDQGGSLARQAELEDQIHNLKAVLQETNDELERTQDALEDAQANRSLSSAELRAKRDRMIEDLEARNEDLLARFEDARDAVAERDQIIENFEDENSTLKLEVERLEHEQLMAARERSESRAEIYEEREEREALEEGNNALRDRLASTTIILEQKENALEGAGQELDQRTQEMLDWKTEAEEQRARVEGLQEGIVEREEQMKEFQIRINDLEASLEETNNRLEDAMASMESEREQRDADMERVRFERDEREIELQAANQDIDRLGHRIYVLEEEVERSAEQHGRELNDALDQAQLHEEMTISLKEKLAQAKGELNQLRNLYDEARALQQERQSREDDLLRRIEDATQVRDDERHQRVKAEREMREYGNQLLDSQDEVKALRRELADIENTLRRELDESNNALEQAQSSLKASRALLEQRESDLNAVQSALRTLENEKRKLGESHTTDRFSLELELDRLKRDLTRCEDELERARDDVKDRERVRRERDGRLDKLHGENRDLSTQLAAQTQARLNMGDKLDAVQANLKQAENELKQAKTRVSELEQKLNQDQRDLLAVENKSRDQLTERNTLLLTIYQYMDKILGVDKTPKKNGAAETKPFSNFAVFHDNLITRLKSLSQIQLDFDRRVKESETRFAEKLVEVKKQLDFRWKQIDRFEASVKNLAEVKNTWRRKYNMKEGELDQAKAANSELVSQLSALRRAPTSESSSDIRSLTARATQAERRATVAQNQLAQLEERLAGQNDRNGVAELKWEARIKEYERLLKEANERFKRERQGGKERVAELETHIKMLQKQIEQTNKRTHLLGEVMDAAGKSS